MSDKEYKWSPENPSPAAVAKVKHPLPVPNFCIHCGAPVRLGTHAKNYIELHYNTPEMGDFTVTIQKHDHKTPGQRIAELEDERADLLMQLKGTVAAWEKGDDVFGGIERARKLIAKLEA